MEGRGKGEGDLIVRGGLTDFLPLIRVGLKLLPRDKGLYISINHFKNDRETNWTELTFAKTSGSVTIGTGEKNWPIADSGVSSTIPETTAECVSASVLFSFLKRRMNTCIGQLVNTCTSLPQKQNV